MEPIITPDATNRTKIAPKVSVIICTYNRGKIFEETLQSFASMKLPGRSCFELLIVDNRSTDKTRSISNEFVAQNEFAKYIYEPEQGLSHARNRGIKDATGSIIAFVDDDVFFDENWLIEIHNAFDRHPEASAIGGRSTPIFDGGRPDWVRDEFLIFYGDTCFGTHERWIEFPDHPFGLNMAFRSEVFDVVGNFNPKLGRIKASLLSGEESDIFERIHKKGLRTWYAPDAHLFHRIPPDRTSLKWIEKRYYWQGVSDAVRTHFSSGASRTRMLTDSISLLRKAVNVMCGAHYSPRKIYWHARSLPVESKTYLHYLYGKSRESFKLAFRPSNRETPGRKAVA